MSAPASEVDAPRLLEHVYPAVGKPGGSRRAWIRSRPVWAVPAIVAAGLAAYSIAVFITRQSGPQLLSSRTEIGIESAAAFTRLFAAAVLFYFPWDEERQRLRWIAAGLVVLGLGSAAFGYLAPVTEVSLSSQCLMYEAVAIWTSAGVLFAVGLLPRTAPDLNLQLVLVASVVLATTVGTVLIASSGLPPLVHGTPQFSGHHGVILAGLTTWHWVVTPVPLLLGVLTLAGTVWRIRRAVTAEWLLTAFLLLVAAEMYNMLWPSTYLPDAGIADILRLLFGLVVVVGAGYELRMVARERTALLAAQREEARRLTDLNVLKAHFTSMVAHELGTPLAAIRLSAQALGSGVVDRDGAAQLLKTIRSEAEMLTSLVSDVQAAARAEQDDFAVRTRPVPLKDLLLDAVAFARVLPGEHPITAPFLASDLVWADRERISQVMRNLLSNAAKYSDPGTPIILRAERRGDVVAIEVEDHGYGIDSRDLVRVFEKFGRGRDRSGQRVPGVGLGLYLSRRIVQAHGSDLTVSSVPGSGSVFGFALEAVL